MAAMPKSSSRYSSFNSQASTTSSADLTSPSLPKSNPNSLSKTKSSDIIKVKPRPDQNNNFTSMMKKFMEKKKPRDRTAVPLIVPADFIAEDLKKTARKGSALSALPKKLFGKAGGGGSGEKKVKAALTDVKANTRTLSMVLRSERELLSLNKEQETEISELKALLNGRNNEVEKLKDLCLKQREEIKALKSAILFPDELNSQLQELLEEQGSELKQARQVIPTLQRQITSLTGQLQYLSEDLAQVKADKYSPSMWSRGGSLSSPRTLAYDYDDALHSPVSPATPGSPDDMFLKDINPCLTPFSIKEKTKGCKGSGYDSLEDEDESFLETRTRAHELNFGIEPMIRRKVSRSTEYCQKTKEGRSGARAPFRSAESKYMHRK